MGPLSLPMLSPMIAFTQHGNFTYRNQPQIDEGVALHTQHHNEYSLWGVEILAPVFPGGCNELTTVFFFRFSLNAAFSIRVYRYPFFHQQRRWGHTVRFRKLGTTNIIHQQKDGACLNGAAGEQTACFGFIVQFMILNSHQLLKGTT